MEAVGPVRRLGPRGKTHLLAVCAIFLLAFTYRAAYLSEARKHPEFDLLYMDEAYHYHWAKGLATGQWDPPYERIRREPYFRAPLYPWFLGMVFRAGGPDPWVARWVQAVVGSLSCVLVYAMGTMCFGPRAGVVAGLACAWSWVLAYYDGELLLPVLEVFLLAAGVLTCMVALREASHLLAGLAGLWLGLFAITRPNIMAVMPFVVWWWLRHARRPARGALLMVGLFLVPVAAVTVRNRVVGHDWVVVSWQGGVNLYIGNNAQSNGMEAVVPGTRHTWWGGFEDTWEAAERAAGRRLKPSEVSRFWTKRALQFIAGQPTRWLRLMVRKAVALAGSVEIPNNEPEEARRRAYVTLRSSPVSFGLLLGLFLVGTISWRPPPHSRPLVRLVVLVAGVYACTILAFFVTGRYRVPLLPLLATGASGTVEELLVAARQRRFTRLLSVGLGSAALLGVLHVDVLGIRKGTADYATLTHAQDLVDLGRVDEAIPILDSLWARGSMRVPEVPLTLIRARLQRDAPGDRARVMEVAAGALVLHPNDPELLWYGLVGCLEARRFDEARSLVDRYLHLRPRDMRGLAVKFALALAQEDTASAQEVARVAASLDPGHPAVESMRAMLGPHLVPDRGAGG